MTLLTLGALAALIGAQAGTPPVVSLDSLLAEMVDRAALARFPEPAYTCRQSSSYDRKSTDPSDAAGWFANADYGQFVRVEDREGRKEHVMHDAEGPGAIVRIWSANPKGTLRVYIDGAESPALEAPMAELLRGGWRVGVPLSLETAKGCNLYLPIPYARRCVITSDEGGFYYQVNYRTYAPGTRVESLTSSSLDASGPALDRARETLEARGTVNAADLMRDLPIAPGNRQAADLPPGPRAIGRLFVRVSAENLDQALRSTVIRMLFDGRETVWCPVGDFFGLGPGTREFRTWWATCSADGVMCLKFTMPYARDAGLMFENLGTQEVRVSAHYVAEPWEWDDRSLYFHATWHAEHPIPTRPMRDWNYVRITGKGVYVGDVLSLMNPVKDWWGEGDEKIYVDGEPFPSHFGTGTEDYYSYAWSNPKTFAGPFNAQPRSDGEALGNCWGRATVMRTRSLDAIPFNTSLKMDMEVWHWKECEVEYAATAYFYARPGVRTNRFPEKENAARPLIEPPPLPPPYKVTGAVELESLGAAARSEGVEAEAQGGFGDDLWSGQQQLWVRGTKIGDFVEIRVPAPDESARRLQLHATRSWDYATVRVSVNGAVALESLDLCSGERKVVATGPIELGEFAPRDGAFTLRVQIVGASAKAVEPKTYFGLDCVVLEPASGSK